MENYIGIDLGTTNSAICTYDKDTLQTRIWKSPETNDVTPSAIYIDRHGHEFVGQTAYNAAPRSPDNCAREFKRIMAKSILIELSAVNLTFTPEECSSKVLKTLFGYLPEEIRNSSDIGTVITVPAAFDQMQKNATMAAAEMAGIGKVELVQEPVAAVMSYMKARGGSDGIFLIYDFGGGTLDIAIAESIRKRVAILAQGGIQMCGGRDFDRTLVDNIVRPWLDENFDLPDDISVNPKYKPLLRLATWATERAKIELSARDESMISLSEVEINTNDLKGDEIYLAIPLYRHTYDELIADQINDTIDAAREILSKTGYTPNDLECIVWVGGPTHYKPLRDKVAFELGIKGDTLDVNPMTAVAEGASIFAESIKDWSGKDEQIPIDTRDETPPIDKHEFTFRAMEQTPDDTTKIVVQVEGQVATGYEFQVVSLDSGSTSGRMPLKHEETVDVTLMKPGENTFSVTVYDAVGNTIKQEEITIEKVLILVDKTPSELSLALEVVRRLEDVGKIGREPDLEYLVQVGDLLPKKGIETFYAAESLESGSSNSLNFKLKETDAMGIERNSELLIRGRDLTEGTIPVNTPLKCSYEKTLGGNIIFEVEVEIDGISRIFNKVEYRGDPTPVASQVAEEGIQIRKRIDHVNEIVDGDSKLEDGDSKLEKARKKVEPAIMLDPEESDDEKVLRRHEGNLTAQKLLNQVEGEPENRKKLRQIDLDDVVEFFDVRIRQFARSSEATEFDKLAETAQRSIDNNDNDFNEHLDELRGRNFQILWRQDWFVIEQFRHLADSPYIFADQDRFEELVHIGKRLMEHPEIQEILSGKAMGTIKSEAVEQLRRIVAQIMSIPRISGVAPHDEMRNLITNILASLDN